MEYTKRFIEEFFPVKEISAGGAKEKSIRHGHISTIHLWWSRKPLTVSRAIVLASLLDAPKNNGEYVKYRDLIIAASKWENLNDKDLILQVEEILQKQNKIGLKFLDPFSGGGSIPLESAAIGLKSFTSDYNPVAIFIQKCILEYPTLYGKLIEREIELNNFKTITKVNPLLADVKHYALKVLELAKSDIGKYFLYHKNNNIKPIGFYWMRTIKCANHDCGIEIPLTPNWWLSKKPLKKISLFPYLHNNTIQFKIVGEGHEPIPKDFDPEKGTISQAITTCPNPDCRSVLDAVRLKEIFRKGLAGERMVAVIEQNDNTSGKYYRIPNKEDIERFDDSTKYLISKRQNLYDNLGFDPVPDEIIQTPTSKAYVHGAPLYNFTPVVLYGMTKFGDLFNERQKLANITFLEKIINIYDQIILDGHKPDYAKAIISYLSLMMDRLVDKNSNLVNYHKIGEKIEHVFGRQAFSMSWDYVELNPFSGMNGDWLSAMQWVLLAIDACSKSTSHISKENVPICSVSSATSLNHPNNFFDIIITDPPYYDNIPYSNLSDYFYVWLKRSTNNLFPELFTTPLSPKIQEIIADEPLLRGLPKRDAITSIPTLKTKKIFEESLKIAFQEIYRTLKPNGIAVIVYAHKSTDGWESVVNALLDCGLVISASWPLNTELQTRLRANDSATLSSSIYIITRKIEKSKTTFYEDVKQELKSYLNKKLDYIWNEGIIGADFFIAGIGFAIEVFGKYEKVMDYDGTIIRADKMLDDVREIVMDYTARQILHNGFSGEINDLTRFYVLWRFSFGEAKAIYDEANKIARSVGIDLDYHFTHTGFIKKEKEFVRVLGPTMRKLDSLEKTTELIDVLHMTLLLWEKDKRPQVNQLLANTGYGKTEAFYRVAQAVSESLAKLTPDSKEKRLIDSFLGAKERIKTEVANTKVNITKQLDLGF
ncbi:MAG: DUF1156 domain-containing protein [Bacteroidetes bacterium]|nr:DUF1156 domain-containing protein [Bacteroidota bacterium]